MSARESPPLGGLATLVLLAFVQAMGTPRWGMPFEMSYESQPSLALALAAGAALAVFLVDTLGFRRTLALSSLAWILARLALTEDAPVVFTSAGTLFDPETTLGIVLFIERYCYHACLASCLVGAARFGTRLRGGPVLGVALVVWAAACAPRVSMPYLPLPAEVAVVAFPLAWISFLRPARPPVRRASAVGATALVLLVASVPLLFWTGPFVPLEELFDRVAPMSFEREWVDRSVDAVRATAGLWLAALVAFVGVGPSAIDRRVRTSLVAIALGCIGVTGVALIVTDWGDAASLGIGLVQRTAFALVHAAAVAVAITRGGTALSAAALATSAAAPAVCVAFLEPFEAGWTFYTIALQPAVSTGVPYAVLVAVYALSVVAFVVAFRRTTPGPVSSNEDGPSNDDGAAQVDDPVASRESDRRD